MGPDEVRARQVLLDMQELLSRDPYEALGLIPSATASDIRNAFLSKTKLFHPARFGRMSSDIQRLANEVFLALRATHDTLARPNVKGAANPRPSGAIPTLGPRPGGTGATPTLRPAPMPATPARPANPHAPSGQSGPHATFGHGNGNGGHPAAGHASGSSPNPTIARPSNWPSTTPATRPGTAPTPIRPPTQPMRTVGEPPTSPNRVASSSGAMPPVSGGNGAARPGGVSGPVPTSGARPAVSGSGPRPAPGSGPRPAPAATAAPVERELVPIYELFAQGQVAAARIALETLIGRSPQSTRYRSLLAFARGREAQLSGRVDEARVELQDALTLDPDLQLAKSALAELFTRRR